MDRTEKQPYEEFTISSNFARNLLSGETIVSQTVSAVTATGEDATADILESPSNDGASKVLVKIKAGEETKSPYKITFRCVTSLTNKWENDVLLKVKEK